MTTALGIDLGGTKIAAALVGADGDVLTPVRTRPTRAREGSAAILDDIAALARTVLADGAAAELAPATAVGLGSAGVIDSAAGTVVSATDAITGWAGTDLAGGLASRLETATAIRVVNDVDAHAMGEAFKGAAAGARIAAMIAVGTGVGGAMVVDGEPLGGAHHFAGEIGHMPIPGAEGIACTCGIAGHLEAIGAGPSHVRVYHARGGDRSVTSAVEVYARARRGEDLAAAVIADATRAVGLAIAAIVAVTDPDVVVLGGGMLGAGTAWIDPVIATARANLVPLVRDVPIVPAALGTHAAIVGAARAAFLATERTSQ
ncbi:ROK family protein [Bowdeniella massiliensis]|uniref:ROK family protein n=1 Tax=Bowdeniella massiliensis TaxID=2932264 RepID=UPI002028323F|nr:ROK family protein [Bowdeniella massiliensis]